MAWDPVPWFTGGDVNGFAEHSPEIARMLSYYLMGGQEGVLGALDLRVLPLSTPGKGIRMMPGSAAINSRWQPLQNYIQRMPQETEVETGPRSPTTSGRTDLVIANVKDPYAPGSPWDVPADQQNGPYIETEVIIDVPPNISHFDDLGITNWTALGAGLIDYDPNTETVTADMIRDMRVVSNPITGTQPSPDVPVVPANASPWFTESSRTISGSVKAWDSNTYTNWPAEANWPVPIPPWATGADIFVQLNPHINGNVWGNIRLNIGGSLGNASYYDADTTGYERAIIWHSGTQPIPADVRGTIANVHVEVQSLLDASQSPGDLIADEHSYVYISLHFKQEPVYI